MKSFCNLLATKVERISREMHFTRDVLNIELVKKEREKYINMSKKEKRKLYTNKHYYTLEDIPTWPKYYAENKLSPEKTGGHADAF